MPRGALNRRQALLSVVVAALVVPGGGIVHGLPAQPGGRTARAAGADTSITWDVAMDCSTWRFNNGIGFDEFGRGDSFIANGKLFPAGTLPDGFYDPDNAASIGNWIERGIMAATSAEIASGTRPAFFANWYHVLDDGSAIVADGPHPESGPMAVVGGMGRFSGASGELTDEIIGSNSTGCPNLRVTIRLEKQAPR